MTPQMKSDLETAGEFVLWLLVASLSFVVALLVCGGLAAWAWNCSMPHLFGLPHATYGNGIGLALLVTMLRGTQIRSIERSAR